MAGLQAKWGYLRHHWHIGHDRSDTSGEGEGQQKDLMRGTIGSLNDLVESDLIDENELMDYVNLLKSKLMKSRPLQQQAASNTKEQFGGSPDLQKELTNAIIGALDTHNALSTEALNQPAVQSELKDILLNLEGLWEELRKKAEAREKRAARASNKPKDDGRGTNDQPTLDRSPETSMEPLPTWQHVEDPDLLAWLRALPAAEQIKLKDRINWMLDRARGDAMMAECIAAPEPEIQSPPGFDDWSDAEQIVWYNEVLVPWSQARAAERRAIKEAVARGEYVP